MSRGWRTWAGGWLLAKHLEALPTMQYRLARHESELPGAREKCRLPILLSVSLALSLSPPLLSLSLTLALSFCLFLSSVRNATAGIWWYENQKSSSEGAAAPPPPPPTPRILRLGLLCLILGGAPPPVWPPTCVATPLWNAPEQLAPWNPQAAYRVKQAHACAGTPDRYVALARTPLTPRRRRSFRARACAKTRARV